jgi:hypothetical protein
MRRVSSCRLFVGFVALWGSLSAGGADARIPLEAKINGRTAALALDTGAGVRLGLFSFATEKFGLKVEPPAPGLTADPGEVLISSTRISTLEIFGSRHSNQLFPVIDVPAYLAGGGIDGLVGWPTFRDGVLDLRIADRRVDAHSGVPPAEVKDWLKVPIVAGANHLKLELPAADGAAGRVILIDTGDPTGVSLNAERWRIWRAAQPGLPTTLSAMYMPGSGLVVREETWAESILLGGLEIRGVAVRLSNRTQEAAGGSDYAASLGLGALERLDLVADGKSGVAYIRARGERPPSMPHNRLGTVFVPRSGDSDDLVATVAQGSPGQAAGVRDGDLLLAIDGGDVTRWRSQPAILPFSQYWERPAGTRTVLTLRRGGETITATAVLRDILGP